MKIRPYQIEDSYALAELFYKTIRTVNIHDYTQQQVEVWAPEKRDMDKWKKSFENKFVFIAEDSKDLLGFGELEANGHIDRFYINANYIGKGVGKKIYQTIQDKAQELKISRLFVEASITARPFFEQMGFKLVKEQIVIRENIGLKNFVMDKILSN